MQVLQIVRKFNYNGIALVDPNPALSIDAVREFYATQYPELNNSVIEGPVTKGQEATYKFLRAVGDKGANNQGATLRGKVRDLAAGKSGATVKVIEPVLTGSCAVIYAACFGVVTSKQVGRPIKMPSQAFGIWG
ncbi:MAG: PRTRC system protein C [Polaromonas sp.]|uniref:PRTRC system protein C n=1 Tax=Polaromonas sp. TaxID=1869339 RepID=UPI00272F8DEB|nr:PRTRC system protein C [Polaromonas sp.]MDP2449103.1 PRTRC system protein C [Polaromonas sp.]MDP3829271.1 PRTRC system protein C [Polaromonas sp.]